MNAHSPALVNAYQFRTLGIDAFACPNGQGRMGVLALVRDPDDVRRFLQTLGEATEPP